MTLTWVRDAVERAVKTAAQTAVALLAADGTSVLTLDWGQAAAVVATATVVSVLTSLGSLRLGDPGTASAVHAGPVPDIAAQVVAQAEQLLPPMLAEAVERAVPDLVDAAESQVSAEIDRLLGRASVAVPAAELLERLRGGRADE